MEHKFFIQDPTDETTVYLYEVLIELLSDQENCEWKSFFAFATAPAIKAILFEEKVAKTFLENNNTDLIVGIDSITNHMALITLQELEKQYPKFKIRVFLNSYNNVFHPKVSHFTDTNGNSTFVVGSGNLTLGGLSNNFEAFSTIIGNENEFIPVRSMWDDFVERHEDIIVPIDDNVIEIAKHNFVSRKEKEKDIKTIQIETDQRRKIIGKKYPSIKQRVRARKKISEPILIARIPKAGGRWRQVHYNRDVIDSFFNIKPNSSQRAFLTEYSLDGTIGDEEIRPLVFSQSNRNLKIEISGRQGEHYPTGNFPPIIVLKKVGVRTFHYTVLMPKDTPYRKIYDYTETIPSIGKGLKRVVVDSNTLSSIWPNCPLCVKAVDPKNWTTC